MASELNEFEFIGDIVDGNKFVPIEEHKPFWDHHVAQLGTVRMKVRKYFPQRSKRQNRTYAKIVIEAIAKHWGWWPHEVRNYLRMDPRFFGYKQSNGMVKPGSSADTDTLQMRDKFDAIQDWAACGFPNEDGEEMYPALVIPNPDPELRTIHD